MDNREKGTLFICATPIGNLEDITIRGLNVLRQIDVIACEDTRRTIKLLNHFEIKPGRLFSFHEHSPPQKVDELIDELASGNDLALVADAGTPCISDPGADLIKVCRQRGFKVTVLPGPSAITAALAVSGFQSDSFVFWGFLNRLSAKERRKIMAQDRNRVAVMFESPHQIITTLQELQEVRGDWEVVVVRELTKKFEEVLPGTPVELKEHFGSQTPRGEITIVIPPQDVPEDSISDYSLKRDLQNLVSAGVPSKHAVKSVALLREVSRKRVYELQLELEGK